MSKNQKLLVRLLTVPSDFTWDEMVTVLGHFGFIELKKGKTGGSRRKFAHENKNVIMLHKPHPGNIVKIYAIKEVITYLKEKKYIQDE